MILCRCTSCSVPCKFDDAQSGTEAPCPGCGGTVTVPAQSADDVVLVFTEKREAEQLLTAEQFAAQQQSGEIAFTDMVWRDDHWDPVGLQSFPDETSPAADAERPKPRLRIGATGTEQEVELPLLQLETPAPAEAPGADGNGGAATPAKPPAKAKTPLMLAAHGVGALLVLYFGYQYGFGPILFNILKKPAVVVVKSGEAVEYEAVLGWRRMKQPLSANGMARFELHVGMPEKQGLTITPVQAGKGTPSKVWVPLAPGRAVIVNLNGKTTFHKVDTTQTRPLKLEAEAEVMMAQIYGQQAPAAAQSVAARLQDIADKGVLGTCADEFIYPAEWRTEYYYDFGTDPAKQKAAKEKVLLTAQPSTRLEFANGGVNRTFANPALIDGAFRVKGGKVRLKPEEKPVLVTIPENTEVRVTRNDKVLEVALAIDGQPFTVSRGKFTGRWDYRATKDLQKQEWKWTWSYSGDGEYDKARAKVRCRWEGEAMPKYELEKTIVVK